MILWISFQLCLLQLKRKCDEHDRPLSSFEVGQTCRIGGCQMLFCPTASSKKKDLSPCGLKSCILKIACRREACEAQPHQTVRYKEPQSDNTKHLSSKQLTLSAGPPTLWWKSLPSTEKIILSVRLVLSMWILCFADVMF